VFAGTYANDVMLGMRYKFQREPVAYVPVK
jgi:hypothetical protein